MRFGPLVAGIIFAIAVIILLTSGDTRPRCNAEGDVRYVGDRKYVCERTKTEGLRWTWKMW